MAVDKLVDSTQLDADLTSVANAIRTKGGTSAQMAFPNGFVSAVNAIPTGGSPTGTKQITITENGTTTEDVAAYANAEISVNVSGGGIDVDDLAEHTIPQGAIEFDSATVIPRYRFDGCSNITSINSSTIEEIKEYAFYGCEGLEDINLPNLTALRNANGTNPNALGYFFQNCYKLKKIHFPKLLNIYGNYGFANCGTSTDAGMIVVLPKIVNLGVRTFRQCKCQDIDLGEDLSGILADTFYNGRYGNLILRGQNVVPAATTNAILDCKNVYVPAALIESYKAATNWSTKYAAGTLTFHAIEGSQYEHYYADGTPIT